MNNSTTIGNQRRALLSMAQNKNININGVNGEMLTKNLNPEFHATDTYTSNHYNSYNKTSATEKDLMKLASFIAQKVVKTLPPDMQATNWAYDLAFSIAYEKLSHFKNFRGRTSWNSQSCHCDNENEKDFDDPQQVDDGISGKSKRPYKSVNGGSEIVVRVEKERSCRCIPIERRAKRDDYVKVPGIGWLKFNTNLESFNSARQTCMEEGAELAFAKNQNEATVG